MCDTTREFSNDILYEQRFMHFQYHDNLSVFDFLIPNMFLQDVTWDNKCIALYSKLHASMDEGEKQRANRKFVTQTEKRKCEK